ncbi:TIGR02265 family protein [Vitiosangium sp. GDMCC 1.1324]|uniref:TIGR02265 family protein n=1 Tax=Vitiosangium sp. (strain GDMCC 1.1324) TaxID=2138576 RepID=UPI000D35F952|nr:TIGR02265 family protein [Vitiosangium sp. GDMCC 1.1324]PTL84176.1 TIGR02265 family protein [Vitiosangium sp. GDMCC 1.1324]
MPSNKTELAARIAVTRPNDGVRGLFFREVFELIEKTGGPHALRQVRTGPLAKDIHDLRTYPAADYLTMLYTAADALEHKLGPEDAVFNACGRACVQRFSHGPGQVVFGILGKGDPQRLFAQTRVAFSTVVTYGKRDHNPIAPKACILAYRGDMQPPAYHVGIFEGALVALGFKGTVTARPLSIDSVDYEITWE